MGKHLVRLAEIIITSLYIEAFTECFLCRYQQVVFPLCTEIQLGVIAQFGFKPDGEGIIQFTQVLLTDPEEHFHSCIKVNG